MISGGSRGLLELVTKAAIPLWFAGAARFDRLIDFNLFLFMEDRSQSAGVTNEVWLDE